MSSDAMEKLFAGNNMEDPAGISTSGGDTDEMEDLYAIEMPADLLVNHTPPPNSHSPFPPSEASVIGISPAASHIEYGMAVPSYNRVYEGIVSFKDHIVHGGWGGHNVPYPRREEILVDDGNAQEEGVLAPMEEAPAEAVSADGDGHGSPPPTAGLELPAPGFHHEMPDPTPLQLEEVHLIPIEGTPSPAGDPESGAAEEEAAVDDTPDIRHSGGGFLGGIEQSLKHGYDIVTHPRKLFRKKIYPEYEATVAPFRDTTQRKEISKEYFDEHQSQQGAHGDKTKDISWLKKSILMDQWILSDASPAPTVYDPQQAMVISSCGWKHALLAGHTQDVMDWERATGYFRMFTRAGLKMIRPPPPPVEKAAGTFESTGQLMVAQSHTPPDANVSAKNLLCMVSCLKDIFGKTGNVVDLERAIEAGVDCIELHAAKGYLRRKAFWAVLNCYVILWDHRDTYGWSAVEKDDDAMTAVSKARRVIQVVGMLPLEVRKDSCRSFRISGYILEGVADIMYAHYQANPNEADAGQVLDYAIEMQAYNVGRVMEDKSVQPWAQGKLATMLTMRHRRNISPDSTDLDHAGWYVQQARSNHESCPPGRDAALMVILADQAAMRYNVKNPESIVHLIEAIRWQCEAVRLGREVARGERPPQEGDMAPNVVEWTIQLEAMLIRRLEHHLSMNDEAGCREVEALIDGQLADVLRLSENAEEAHSAVVKAQVLLTGAWRTFMHARYAPHDHDDKTDDGRERAQPEEAQKTAAGDDALVHPFMVDSEKAAVVLVPEESKVPPTAQEMMAMEINNAIEQAFEALVVVAEFQQGRATTTPVPINIRNALSQFYLARYDCSGNADDLQTAARYAQDCVRALSPTPDTIEYLHLYLLSCHSLASILMERFRSVGAKEDLLAAIDYARIAAEQASADRLLKATYQVTLAQYLELEVQTRREAGEKVDTPDVAQRLAEGVGMLGTAWTVLDNYGNRQLKLACQNTLCTLYVEQYECSGRGPECAPLLLKAIGLGERILHETVFEGADKLSVLSTLSDAYALHPQRAVGLPAAVRYARMAVDECPREHFQAVELSYKLAALQSQLYEGELPARIAMIMKSLDLCLAKEDAPPSYRLKAAVLASSLLIKLKKWPDLYRVNKIAMELLPLLCVKALPQRDQQSALKNISGLGSTAAAAALEMNQRPEDALLLLEQGRDVIASNRFDTRIDMTRLRAVYPQLAERFDALREELDPAGVNVEMNLRAYSRYEGFGQKSDQVRAITGRLLAANNRLMVLVTEIQKLKGFETFLGQPSVDTLADAAADGTIVVVNVSAWRCDAFIVQKTMPKVRLVRLTSLQESKIDDMLLEGRSNGRAPIDVSTSQDAMNWMWDSITLPVLTELNVTEDSSPGDYDSFSRTAPRIWWILTRNTSRLPVHAGMSPPGEEPAHRVVNRVISSYATSIKALIFSRQLLATRLEFKKPKSGHALLCAVPDVGMYPGSEGLESLPTAKIETQQIKAILDGPMDVQQWIAARAQPVLSALTPPSNPTPSVFHFAGHGKSDRMDPSSSAIFLADKPLTVDRLLRARLYKTCPVLAYLSACSTGTTTLLPDEGVHVMSGFVSAGFMNVVGTLWDTDDVVSLAVASNMYKRWVETGMGPDGLARCLHYAVAKTKQDWTNKAAIARAASADNWACFVHMGV
ncbi:CHAT domain-containing protein [Peziza echinospora]|nr:CHAT domain-containing protein [Peziza echinospora]